MTRTRIYLSLYILLIGCALQLAAQNTTGADSVVPGVVRFAGVLNQAAVQPFPGTVGVTFLLYKDHSGGAPLWMETQNVKVDESGHYSVMLGSTTSHGIPADAFVAGEARWIGVQVSGQAEQARVQLVSVPYALKAADAQTLGGLPASAFLLAQAPASTTTAVPPAASQVQNAAATAVTTPGGTAQALAKFDAKSDIANSQIFDNGTNVGIGTNAPTAKLDVHGGILVRGPVNLPSVGNATAAAGTNSQPVNLATSAFNSGNAQVVKSTFRLQAEPTGNNTANPSAKLNLLYGTGTGAVSETGLSISNTGVISFAPGQYFPGAGTVTSVGLNAPSSDFVVDGSPVTGSGTLNLEWLIPPTWYGIADSIVKRDDNGGFGAGYVDASDHLSTNNVFAGHVYATNSDTGNGLAVVQGYSRATGAAGITAGVFGRSDSDNGRGLWAQSVGTNGYAVYGESFGTSGTGVFGSSAGSSGSGVVAFNSGSGDGLYAESTSGFAAFFLGDVDVDGTLSKAAGSFKIDHPLDPANKYLYHSFVESPDMKNMYDGMVTLSASGEAEVELPDWFEALNQDFRYQLTAIGAPANLYIARKVQNGRFKIAGGQPGMEVSWQITGTRHDAYANAHRIPVEQQKPEQERGSYMHPELFGATRDKSIAAARHPGAMRLAKEGNIKPTGPARQ